MGGKLSTTQLVEPKTPAEEDDGEDADKQDESATSHLIDRDRGVEQADVHQLYGRIVTEEANRRHRRAEVIVMRDIGRERISRGRTVVPVRSQAAGNHKSKTFQPWRCSWGISAFAPAAGSSSESAGRLRGWDWRLERTQV